MYYMIILDFLPDNTARVYYWNNEIGLVDSASDATKYPTADDCQDDFDDSFFQGECGNILTYDPITENYTYERHVAYMPE